MLARTAEYECLKCHHTWIGKPGPITCPKCRHLYVKWTNYPEPTAYNVPGSTQYTPSATLSPTPDVSQT